MHPTFRITLVATVAPSSVRRQCPSARLLACRDDRPSARALLSPDAAYHHTSTVCRYAAAVAAADDDDRVVAADDACEILYGHCVTHGRCSFTGARRLRNCNSDVHHSVVGGGFAIVPSRKRNKQMYLWAETIAAYQSRISMCVRYKDARLCCRPIPPSTAPCHSVEINYACIKLVLALASCWILPFCTRESLWSDCLSRRASQAVYSAVKSPGSL